MTRYHAHPNGYLTIDDDPKPVVEVCRVDDSVRPGPEYLAIRNARLDALSQLASDANHAREWAALAADIVAGDHGSHSTDRLLRAMAKYHREHAS